VGRCRGTIAIVSYSHQRETCERTVHQTHKPQWVNLERRQADGIHLTPYTFQSSNHLPIGHFGSEVESRFTLIQRYTANFVSIFYRTYVERQFCLALQRTTLNSEHNCRRTTLSFSSPADALHVLPVPLHGDSRQSMFHRLYS
jgi:hypothetical protein